MTRPLEDRLAFITGGGDGIGRACAQALARDGARVCVGDIRADMAEQTAEQIRATGADALAVACDVRSEADWEAADAAMRARWPDAPLRVLVNNAGVPPSYHYLDAMPLEAWRDVMAVHADGAFLGCRLAMRRMTEGGAVANLSSALALRGAPRAADYTAAKGAVRALTLAAAAEGGPRGIRFASLHPGFIDTRMPRDMIHDYATSPEHEEAVLERVRSRHLLGRFGKPEEVAAFVAFFASDAGSFLTGIEIAIDGGLTARLP